MRQRRQDTPTVEDIAAMIRVNQAGEYGAVRIYQGQLAVLNQTEHGPLLHHMLEQERHHLERFDELLAERHIRPTLLSPLWHMAGYALGVVTAKLGPTAAMACTEAVEEVIDDHYERQAQQLDKHDPTLTDLIRTCQKEEQEHRDLSREQGAHNAPLYPVLTTAIKAGSRLAIWLSKRI